MTAADLPEPVRAVCDTWLEEMSPTGLVTGLHLRGGLGFGEWVPGRSDVDFVATLARRPSYTDLDAIEAAHLVAQERHPDVPFDGLHLLADDLRADPEECPDVPCVLHGHFEEAARYDVSPVAWHELARHGVTVLGPDAASLGIWTDDVRLRDFTRANLDGYWREQAEGLAKFPAEAAGEPACEWCVLGVVRLHHLLVTGSMTAKSAAARWGLGSYDERWHRVLREALRIREGGDPVYDDPRERGADVTAFTAWVVEQGTGS